MPSIRWAFNISKWEPSESEFLFVSSCLQSEEKHRIDKFVYKKDVKASLVGRLMIRKFIAEHTNVAYKDIKLSRDVNNKPIHIETGSTIPNVSFNISHHGSFTVLAGETGYRNVGVDVMKLEYSGGKTLEEFFRIMKRNFTSSEWLYIKGNYGNSEQNKITNFCRNWALKESYVKACGMGLKLDLHKINFDIRSTLQTGRVISNTALYINNERQPWIFEESLLDQQHCVAVALEQQNYNVDTALNNSIFYELTPANLLENAVPLLLADYEYCNRYFKKS